MPTTLFAALPSHKSIVPLDGPSVPNAGYPGLAPNQVKVLKAKVVAKRGGLPLPCDIHWERDIACSLRDGTVIYVDVFRPTGDKEKYPCLVAWGPYGKHGGGRWAEVCVRFIYIYSLNVLVEARVRNGGLQIQIIGLADLARVGLGGCKLVSSTADGPIIDQIPHFG